MKYDFELLRADVLKELDNIKILESEFAKTKKMLRLPAGKVAYYDRGLLDTSYTVSIMELCSDRNTQPAFYRLVYPIRTKKIFAPFAPSRFNRFFIRSLLVAQ